VMEKRVNKLFHKQQHMDTEHFEALDSIHPRAFWGYCSTLRESGKYLSHERRDEKTVRDPQGLAHLLRRTIPELTARVRNS
jgi:hypothetical protein